MRPALTVLMTATLLPATALCSDAVVGEAMPGEAVSEAAATLAPGDFATQVRKSEAIKGGIEMEGAALLDITAERLWPLLTDCTAQMRFVPGLKACEVLARDDTDPAMPSDVRRQTFKYAFPFPTLRSDVRSDYVPGRSIRSETVDSDLGAMSAVWELTPMPEGRTWLSYRATLDPSVPVPRSMIRKSSAKDLPLLFERLRSVVAESR